MWYSPGWMIDMQRKAALGVMSEQARDLQREGYQVDADQMIDEIRERQRKWERDDMGSTAS